MQHSVDCLHKIEIQKPPYTAIGRTEAALEQIKNKIRRKLIFLFKSNVGMMHFN